MNDVEVAVLFWPSCSFDFNSCNSFCFIFVRRVYASSCQIRAVRNLKLELKKYWNEIEEHVLFTLCDSMQRRMKDVIWAHGRSVV